MNAAAPDVDIDLDSLAVGLSEVMRDFRKFCALLPIKTKSQGIVNFNYGRWHDEQKQFERERTGWDLVLKSRQIGYTTEELARDFHHALTHEGHNVLVVVHDEKLKSQLFEALRMMAEAIQELGLLPATRYSTKTELVFRDTGSAVRIVEAGETERSAEKKGRSGTVHRLHATEMAFWGAPGNTMAAILSSVVDRQEGGELVIESTPNGAGGMFHDLVKAARNNPESQYKLHFFPWWKHRAYSRPTTPGFDPAPRSDWEKRLRKLGCTDKQISWWRTKVDDPAIGTDKALAEFPIDEETCFRAAGRTYIQPETTDYLATTVRAAIRKAKLVWKGLALGEAHIFANPLPGRRYVIGGDVAEGIGKDNHAAVVLDKATGQMMATFCCNNIEPGDYGIALCVLGYIYNTAIIGPERNNHGHAAIRVITRTIKYKKVFRTKDRRVGWDTNPATRPPLFDELHKACSTHAYSCPDVRVLAEAKTLIIDKDGRPRARDKGKKDGCQDDLWVAWAIAHQIRSTPDTPTGGFKFSGA